MFGIGGPELIVILVMALLVIGPKKLPDLARGIGKGMAELRKATQQVKESLEVDESFKEVKEMKKDLEDSISGLNQPLDALNMNKWEEVVKSQVEGDAKSDEALAPPDTQGKAAETEAKKNGKG
jgi:Tat protein translocase TatB subunit